MLGTMCCFFQTSAFGIGSYSAVSHGALRRIEPRADRITSGIRPPWRGR
jgi:hypothetical protein